MRWTMKRPSGESPLITFHLNEEDAEHFRDWQRLSRDEKEALTKLAKTLGSEEKRKSFYSLLEAQNEISGLIVTANHIGWLGRMFLKAGAIAGVIIAVFTVYKILVMGK